MLIYLNNKKNLLNLGKTLAKILYPDLKFFLSGSLGLGKTSLSKSIIGTFIKNKKNIKSPTYNIIENYFNKNIYLYHFDFYKFKKKNKDINFINYSKKSILFIEWGEIFISDFYTKKILVYIFYFSKTYDRLIFINSDKFFLIKILT